MEIENLKVHVRKGCLSNIKVGGGTNKNEAFHRYVNTFFHKSRIGILLSYALMMTIVHQYNSRNHSSRKSIINPVCVCDDTAIANEPMGIVSSDAIGQDQSWQQDHTDDIIDTTSILNILQASLSQLYILKAMKSQKTANGNYFFTSDALSLINSKERSVSLEVISSLGLTMSAPTTVLACKLREVIVQEWLGPNRCEYECMFC